MRQKNHTLQQLAKHVGAEISGDANLEIRGLGSLEHAAADEISYLGAPRYRPLLETTQAAAVILGQDEAAGCNLPALICDNPYLAFARISRLFGEPTPAHPGIHPSASVAADAVIGKDVVIGCNSVVGLGCRIGDGAVIGPNCVLMEDGRVGANCRLLAQVVLGPRTRLGERVTIHPGAVIGADGFGYAEDRGRWIKIEQTGGLVIGDDVEIGANTTIDRGTLDDTVIEEGVKIDNQVQIGHNVRIGAHTAVAGCVGIAGSAKIGRYCRIGGAAGINGHIQICDGVTISGMTAVMQSISKKGRYTSGTPQLEHRLWLKNALRFCDLNGLAARLGAVEKKAK